MNAHSQNEIVLYQPDNSLRLEVWLENEPVWLNRQQIAVLFGRDVKTIGKHINNVFSEGELERKVVVAKFATTTPHGAIEGKTQTINVEYVDESVLLLLAKRQSGVTARIYTGKFSRQLQLDLAKHNAQYEPVTITQSNTFHDRFLLVDDTVYHIGASLKDLGRKLFAFSKMETKAADILKSV